MFDSAGNAALLACEYFHDNSVGEKKNDKKS
jgi:hypothetical protein